GCKPWPPAAGPAATGAHGRGDGPNCRAARLRRPRRFAAPFAALCWRPQRLNHQQRPRSSPMSSPAPASQSRSQPVLARAEPESVGLSSARLRRLGEPLQPDAIFSIASMTKAMTSVAIMSLVEEGRVLLGDPVAKYLPPLAALQVAEPSGATRSPGHKLYPGSSVWAAERMGKEEVIAALAKAPLLFDPGSDWEYGFSTDVLGFVVEAVTGEPLGRVLQARIWEPLGMSDTGFVLPAGKRARYALALAKDPVTGSANAVVHHATDKTQKWESGGGGCVSTAADYLRFAEMLRCGGALGGARVLGRGTVALMTADHLPASFNNMIA